MNQSCVWRSNMSFKHGVHGVHGVKVFRILSTRSPLTDADPSVAVLPLILRPRLKDCHHRQLVQPQHSRAPPVRVTQHKHTQKESRIGGRGILHLGGINGRYYPLTLGPHRDAIFATNRVQQPQYAPHCPNIYLARVGWYHTERMTVGMVGIIGMVDMMNASSAGL